MLAPVSAQEPVDVNIVINGQALDKDVPPMMVDGRVLIPLRKVFNALGAEVKYENKVISATRGTQSVVLSPGQKAAQIDGKDVELDVPPMLVETVTYVPLRFVAQALGDEVSYDAQAKSITVAKSAPAVDLPPDRITILKSSLKRLAVGNQGAILKLWNEDLSGVDYYRGIDDRATAPYSLEDQQAMLSALGYSSSVEEIALEVMEAYTLLPKREAVAFLGLVHSIPDSSPFNPTSATDAAIKTFLIEVLQQDRDVVVRRQACLSLAVGDLLDSEILTAILDFYAGSENLWETFPVQQFFEFQASKIRTLPNLSEIRNRVAAVNSLYTPTALRYLDGEQN